MADLFDGPETLVRVVGPNFVAGLVIVNDRCVECAPYLRKTCKWRTSTQLRDLFTRLGWRASVIKPRQS